MAGWSSLPADLLREVSQRVSSDADHLHIHQVCTHWRASTSPPADRRPWIVAGSGRWYEVRPVGDYSFYPPHGLERVDFGAPTTLPFCCGTTLGWLALVDDLKSPTRFVLWEPLSKAEITLPPLPAIVQVFLPVDPLTSPDWMAIAGQNVYDIGLKLFFWRPGDEAWSILPAVCVGRIDSLAFHDAKLYFTNDVFTIFIYDLKLGTASTPERLWQCCVCTVHPLYNYDKYIFVRGVHLVTCNGDLLFAVLRWGDHPLFAEVYKPEWREGGLDLHERLTDLGDYSLFFGRGDAFALSAKEFPAIKRNCVYYAVHDVQYEKQYWSIVFDLGSNVIEKIPYPEEHKDDGSNWLPFTWFCLRRPIFKP